MKLKEGWVFFVVFCSTIFCSSQGQFSSFGSCGILTPPRNAVIQGCTRGGREGSRCTVRCEFGFRAEQTVRFCTCIGVFCVWQGNNPTCEDRRCVEPDITNGQVTIVDTWENGFAGLIEFSDVNRVSREGWSVLVTFNQNMGPNARMSSWSSEPTSVSENYNAFTLSSPEQSDRTEFRISSNFKSLFVVTGVSGKLPTKGYVGMFSNRILDATCYRPPAMVTMNNMTFLGSSTSDRIITTTQPPPSTTLPSSSQPTTSTTSAATTPLTTTTTISSPKVFFWTTTLPPTTTTTSTSTIDPGATSGNASVNSLSIDSSSSNSTETGEEISDANIFGREIDGMHCVFQRHSKSYRTQQGWVDSTTAHFSGNAVVLVPDNRLTNWMVIIVFQRPVLSIQVWNTVVEGSEAESFIWKLGPHTFNRELHGVELDVNFIAEVPITVSKENPKGEVYLCSLNFPDGDPIRLPNEDGTFPPPGVSTFTYSVLSTTTATTTTTPYVSRVTVTYRPDTSTRCQASSPMGVKSTSSKQSRPRWKRSKDKTKYNYNELLSKSIFFYEAQRSGYLPPRYKRVPWRGNSMLKDGCSVGVDLSRGWFDAGDYVKFTFPMAAAVTTLAWGGIEFRNSYGKAGVLIRFLGSIRWPVDYLIKTHLSDEELVALVGNAKVDHASWSRPEDWTRDRPIYTISPDRPGSELAAETAAALASTSILLKRSHRSLSTKALRHAKILYKFAQKYKGDYHETVPEVREFYRSFSGYTDELIWGAAWLYKATGNRTYLAEAERLYRNAGGAHLTGIEYSWDQKIVGAQVLLANLTGEEIYRSGVVRFMERVLSSTQVTPQGMLWFGVHGPNRYAANAAMIGVMAYGLEPPLPGRDRYLAWARKQIHLLLGDAGRSYVVGFGSNYPQQPHHRASSCPAPPASCDWNAFRNPLPNNFILYGALVGGPDRMGNYLDSRQNYQQSEVAIDYNAGFQTAIAGLKYYVATESAASS